MKKLLLFSVLDKTPALKYVGKFRSKSLDSESSGRISKKTTPNKKSAMSTYMSITAKRRGILLWLAFVPCGLFQEG